MNEQGTRSVLRVTASARPKRVAILVDPAGLSPSELDELTSDCSSFWGGGYWPIIPTDGQEISADWWSVLQATDPDFVYALGPLGDALHDRIQRAIAPAQVENVSLEDARRHGGFDISFHDVAGIATHELVQYHAQRWILFPATRFLYLTDSAAPAADRKFALRNFGLVRPTISSDAAFKPVDHQRVAVQDITKSQLLEPFISFYGAFVVPRDLSRLYAPRPFDLAYDTFARGFHLIVGDSISDGLFAWNRSLTSEGHAGRDFLWLDSASAREPEFVALAAEWIKRVFWNNQQDRRGFVVSYSEDIELLRDIAATVKKIAWLGCDAVRLNEGQFPFATQPSSRLLRYPSFFEEGPRRTDQISMSRDHGLLVVPRPPFVGSSASHEGWMLDLDIEYDLDPPRFTNQSDSWRLPRRAILGQLFSHGRRQARIVNGGLPSVAVASNERTIAIDIPSKEQLLHYLLRPLPAQEDPAKAGQSFPQSRYPNVQISEQGRRFRGLVNLFEGVTSAGRTFRDEFWRTVFLQGSGKDSEYIAKRTGIVRQEILAAGESAMGASSAGPTDAADSSATDYEAVARKIATRLHQITTPTRTFTRHQLRSLYGQLNADAKIPSGKGERPIRFDDDADYELGWLLEIGALLQGVTLTCPTCGITQWRIVDDLGRVVRCEGCTSPFHLPPDPPWTFRVNALVQTALSRDGVLPLLHAAYELAERAREMVIVIPPQELRESYDDPPVTDLDVIVVRDGRFVIGEVKSHPAAFDRATVRTLETVARVIRPDVVLLAAPGSVWPEDVRRRIEELKHALTSMDIEVRDQLLDW